ncbi:MAG: alpha amylase C-terminal domain-containing protein [Deltaproteobacteria bacterium]|nr:alpha amylase C-terminal domain-containing protein [Deltaproteobacteria bacterium]
MRYKLYFPVFVLLALQLTGSCTTQDPDEIMGSSFIKKINVGDWRDEVIYQVLVDRFDDGDVNNNYNVDRSAMAKYHGGDWQGLINRMDYLESLGITAIWISPVVRNVEEDAGFGSYHGYWTQDFLSVNPHFGDLTDLRRLVDAAHKRNIKVILDVVTNHVGQLFFYDINGNGSPDDTLMGSGSDSPLTRITEWDPDYDSRGIQGWTSLGESGPAPIIWVNMPEINRLPPNPGEFHNDNWFNKRGRVTVWGREGQACIDLGLSGGPDDYGTDCHNYIREQELYGDFPGGLKDLKTELPEVRKALIDVFKYWIRVADFDGFRIDTVKHVEHEFWVEFNSAIRDYAVNTLGKKNFFIFGEAFSGLDWLLASYTGGEMFDGVFYFSQKFRVFDNVFKNGEATANVETLLNLRLTGENGMAPYASEGNTNGPKDTDDEEISPRSMLVNFMDNHDVPRFLFDKPSIDALHNALVYLYTWDGIPCLYYGTEQQFSGGNDPMNREDMFESLNMPVSESGKRYGVFNTENPTFLTVQTLISIRKEYAPLRRGGVVMRYKSDVRSDNNETDTNGYPLYPMRGIIAFERSYKGDIVLVVMNASDTLTSYTHDYSNNPMVTSFSQGTSLVNVYCGDHVCEGTEGGTFVTTTGGGLDITLPPRQAVILVKQ